MGVASRPQPVAARPTVVADALDHSTFKIFAACFAPPKLSCGSWPDFLPMSCSPSGDCGVMTRISFLSCNTSVPPSRSTPLDKAFCPRHPDRMAFEPESPSPLDSLRQEYARVFRDWDGLT